MRDNAGALLISDLLFSDKLVIECQNSPSFNIQLHLPAIGGFRLLSRVACLAGAKAEKYDNVPEKYNGMTHEEVTILKYEQQGEFLKTQKSSLPQQEGSFLITH